MHWSTFTFALPQVGSSDSIVLTNVYHFLGDMLYPHVRLMLWFTLWTLMYNCSHLTFSKTDGQAISNHTCETEAWHIAQKPCIVERTLVSEAVPCINAIISRSVNISRPAIPSSLVQFAIVFEYDIRERMWSKCSTTVRHWSGSNWLATPSLSAEHSTVSGWTGQFSCTHPTRCAS